MVIAALLIFATLLVAWILAPTDRETISIDLATDGEAMDQVMSAGTEAQPVARAA